MTRSDSQSTPKESIMFRLSTFSKPCLILAFALLIPSFAAAEGNKHRLLLTNTEASNVVAYDQHTGAFLGELIAGGTGGLDHPDSMIIGSDGLLYISSGITLAGSAVLRFDADTGDFIDTFAAGGGIFRPYGITFGPDGLLYVASFLSDELLRFDADTGAFVDVFATGDALPGGLNGPDGLAFGPDGLLYVTTQGSVAVGGVPTFPGLPSQVLRYDIYTGTSDVFATPAASPEGFGFVSLLGIEFTPDCKNPQSVHCDVFVSDFANDIHRYDLDGNLEATYSTNYTQTLPSSNFVGGLSFGRGGKLYSVGFDNGDPAAPGAILRYKWKANQPFPAAGQPSAIFVGPTNDLVRPIGILALPRP
jgi:hypothetical protein